jgi:hypothetical protein
MWTASCWRSQWQAEQGKASALRPLVVVRSHGGGKETHRAPSGLRSEPQAEAQQASPAPPRVSPSPAPAVPAVSSYNKRAPQPRGPRARRARHIHPATAISRRKQPRSRPGAPPRPAPAAAPRAGCRAAPPPPTTTAAAVAEHGRRSRGRPEPLRLRYAPSTTPLRDPRSPYTFPPWPAWSGSSVRFGSGESPGEAAGVTHGSSIWARATAAEFFFSSDLELISPPLPLLL